MSVCKLVLALAFALAFAETPSFGASALRLDPTFSSAILGPHLEVLIDDTHELGVSDVLRPVNAARFAKPEKETPSYGFSKAAYWLRFAVTNESGRDGEFRLEVAHPVLDEVTLYEGLDQEVPSVRRMGDLLPFSTNEVDYRNFIFKLDLKSGETREMLLRVRSSSSVSIPVTMWSREAFENKRAKEQTVLGVYYGAMIALVLYNTFLFISTRNTAYGLYIGFITTFITVVMASNGFAYQYLWPNSAYMTTISPSLFTSISGAFVSLFTVSFLSMGKTRAGRFLTRLSWVYVVIAVASLFLDASLTFPAAVVVAMPNTMLTLSIAVYLMFKGNRAARFYVAAWSMLLLGIMTYMMTKFGWLNVSLFTTYGLQVGSIVEALLLSLGLGDKYNEIRKEQFRNQDLIIKGLEKIARLKSQLEKILVVTTELAGFKKPLAAAAHAAQHVTIELPKARQADVYLAATAESGQEVRVHKLLEAGRALSVPVACAKPTNEAVEIALVWGEETLGHLLFNGFDGVTLDDEELHFAKTLSTSLASALKNLNYQVNLENLVDERTKELKSALVTVTEKTRKIQSILDHIQQGILTFGEPLTIDDQYSRFLCSLYQVKPEQLGGAAIVGALFPSSSLSLDELSHLEQTLKISVGESILFWDMNSDGLVRETTIIVGGQRRTIALDWTPMADEHDVVVKVMLSIRDVTEQRALEVEVDRQKQENRRITEVISELIKIDRARMAEFFAQTMPRMAAATTLAASGGDLAAFARELHTIKGQSRHVGLRKIAELTHLAESALATAAPDAPGTALKDAVALLDAELRFVSNVFHEVLAVPAHESSWNLPVFTGRLAQILQSTLEQGGCELRALVCQDQVLAWHPDFARALSEMLTHALNNCVDHGFVLPRRSGKAVAAAAFEVSAQVRAGEVVIELGDNGAGLDMAAIGRLARSRSSDPRVHANPVEILFHDGASTAGEVTLTSGRGIGLAAIRHIAREWSGDVTIGNRPEGGSRLTITVPRERAISAQVDLTTRGVA